jgi:hypothetical protein
MKSILLRSLELVALLITATAYADEAMTVLQDMGSKYQTAWSSGEAGKLADLYVQDAVLSNGVLGALKGKAVADQMKKSPKITVSPTAANQNGNVVWGYGKFIFPRWTERALRDYTHQRRGFVVYRHADF